VHRRCGEKAHSFYTTLHQIQRGVQFNNLAILFQGKMSLISNRQKCGWAVTGVAMKMRDSEHSQTMLNILK
jgi:hypothetical protein